MTEARYAIDAVGIWHHVAALSEVSPEAVGLCRYRFTLNRASTERRPKEEFICHGCRAAEARVSNPQANGENA